MKRSRGKSLNQEMNLTNMIDVVFAILIVFLISAPLMSQGVKVELPDAKAPSIQQEQQMLKVTIDKDGKIYIEDMEVKIDDFDEIFKSYFKDDSTIVVINADESLRYGLPMKVMALIQTAGGKRLGFLTSNKEEKNIKRKKR